jgi:hypothetical protein
MSVDKKHLHYFFAIGDPSNERVIVDSLHNKSKSKCWKQKSYEEHFMNLELSGLLGNSARSVALDNVKKSLSRILKEHSLNENNILLVERFDEIKQCLPVKDTEDIGAVCRWVNSKLEDTSECMSYIYNNRVDLVKFMVIVDKLAEEVDGLSQYRLPRADKDLGGGLIWDSYSKERLIERIKWFFNFLQKSFIFLVEGNFDALREYLPDYSNLPYKYKVEVQFPETSVNRHDSEPVMLYYYIPVESHDDCIPEVTITEKRPISRDIQEEIEESYRNKRRYIDNIRYSYAGVTRTLYELRTGCALPILANSYEMLKGNLESIFGRIW